MEVQQVIDEKTALLTSIQANAAKVQAEIDALEAMQTEVNQLRGG